MLLRKEVASKLEKCCDVKSSWIVVALARTGGLRLKRCVVVEEEEEEEERSTIWKMFEQELEQGSKEKNVQKMLFGGRSTKMYFR